MKMIMLSEGYSLVEIQDEPVPLSQTPTVSGEYFGIVVGVMIFMMIAWIIGVYLLNCYRYRSRIRELKGEAAVYCGWNLRHLRETAMDMELQQAEQIVTDMQEIFQKKVREVEPFCK